VLQFVTQDEPGVPEILKIIRLRDDQTLECDIHYLAGEAATILVAKRRRTPPFDRQHSVETHKWLHNSKQLEKVRRAAHHLGRRRNQALTHRAIVDDDQGLRTPDGGRSLQPYRRVEESPRGSRSWRLG